MENFRQKILSKKFLNFAEKPVTDEELAIAGILQRFISAYNQANIYEISSLLSNNAEIEGLATDGFVKKNVYLPLLQNNINRIRSLTFNNAIIRINNGGAKAYGLLNMRLVDGRLCEADVFFKLLRKEINWFISQIVVQDPIWLR